MLSVKAWTLTVSLWAEDLPVKTSTIDYKRKSEVRYGCVLFNQFSGLAAAIRLKQLDADCNVCVIEKGSELGAHILSGNVFEPRALDELIPDWKEKGAPVSTAVQEDAFYFLTETQSLQIPNFLLPPQLHNEGTSWEGNIG